MALMLAVCRLAAVEKSTTVVYINGTKYYVHVVRSGDTLYSLAKAYEVSEQDIVGCNAGLDAASLKLDQTIKIPVADKQPRQLTRKEKKQFRRHSVKSGETLYSIARRYGISVATVIEDNPAIDPTALPIGTELLIRKSEMGDASTDEVDREWNSYKETLNTLSPQDSAAYHIVQPGETVYSLSRRFGMTEEEFTALNDLRDGLKAGAIVRVARTDAQPILPADTLGGMEPQPADSTYFDRRGELPAIELRRLDRYDRLDIALMLPVSVGQKVNDNYIDFYKGFLLALEELKTAEGLDATLSVFNTAHDPQRIADIVDYDERFRRSDLIVGPVYEDEMRYVLRYAEERATPVISPLSTISGTKSPVLFQMQAAVGHKYDKFSDLVDGSREIAVIYAASNDMEFAAEVMPMLSAAGYTAYNFTFNRTPVICRRNADGSNGEHVETNSLVRSRADKLFVIMADKETDIDRILTTLSSAKSSITDRGQSIGGYVVLGNRKWTRLNNIDRRIFFKNDVIFPSPYHAKRSDEAVRLFDSRYIKAFGTLPSMFSYRGYDAAVIFCRAMYRGAESAVTGQTLTPLTTGYKFGYEEGIYTNTNWTREHYHSNFTITAE